MSELTSCDKSRASATIAGALSAADRNAATAGEEAPATQRRKLGAAQERSPRRADRSDAQRTRQRDCVFAAMADSPSLVSMGSPPGRERAEVETQPSGERQLRNVSLRIASRGESPLIGEDRRLTLSFSSEEPVPRAFGDEVLSHAKGAADFSRLNDGAPLLWNHDTSRVIGVVEEAWLEKNRGMATVRFARSAEGEEFMALVNDGIVRNVSFAYEVSRYQANEASRDAPQYVATSWLAYEISLVSIPADQSVGVGRSITTPKGTLMERNTEEGDGQRGSRSERLRTQGFADGREHGERAGRQAEADRILHIQAMGDQFNQRELAAQLVRSGASYDAARAAAVD
jgi:HK97 family phage prohead protease